MARSARALVSLGIALLVAILAAGASGFSDELENYRRLQAMPRERRADLAENLERFDRLEPAEQAALRKLDQAIARKDPVDQARYRATLRRYHLWINGLSEEQKRKIEAAGGPDERFTEARKARLREAEAQARKGVRVSGIRTGDYGLDGPSEDAFLLKIWGHLTRRQQEEITRRKGKELRDQIRDHASATGVRRDWPLLSEEAAFVARLDADPDFKSLLGPLAKKAAEAASKKGEDPKKKGEALRRFRHPFAEFLYFEDHPVRPVEARHLDRFAASSPAWFLETLDPLSAEDARNYLTIVYRQIYTHPAEMPEPASAKPKAEPSRKPQANSPLP